MDSYSKQEDFCIKFYKDIFLFVVLNISFFKTFLDIHVFFTSNTIFYDFTLIRKQYFNNVANNTSFIVTNTLIIRKPK